MDLKTLCIAGISLGALALLFGMVWQPLCNNKIMISAVGNGINIYKSITHNKSFDNRIFPPPQTTGDNIFKTSTDYLRCFVTSGYINVEFGFFSSPGFMPPHDLAPEQFTSDYNIWCLVADIKPDDGNNTPVLFTKNLVLESLDEMPRLTNSLPFGRHGVVVIQKDATGRILKEDEIENYFSALGLNNKVLRP